jgi:hypothetical protein
MVLGSTQPLTDMNTRSISWGKGGRCVRLKTLPPSSAVVTKSGNLNFLEPSGPLQACNGTDLLFYNVNCVAARQCTLSVKKLNTFILVFHYIYRQLHSNPSNKIKFTDMPLYLISQQEISSRYYQCGT